MEYLRNAPIFMLAATLSDNPCNFGGGTGRKTKK